VERGWGLWGHPAFVAALRPLVSVLFQELPTSLREEDWDQYARAVGTLHIDNLGSAGTSLLLAWMGIHAVSPEFRFRSHCKDKLAHVRRLTANVWRQGVAWQRTLVMAYVEYDLEGCSGCVKGSAVRENAYQGEVLVDSRWLRATTPPFNAFADRRTCCEFRFFDDLIEELSRKQMLAKAASRATVHG